MAEGIKEVVQPITPRFAASAALFVLVALLAVCVCAEPRGFHSCSSSLDAVVFCPVPLEARLQLSFPKQGK